MFRKFPALIFLMGLGLASCGRDTLGLNGRGPNDSDGAVRDSGPFDGSLVDSGVRDAGRRDAGALFDAGRRDGGPFPIRDAGFPRRDAGIRDGGRPPRDGGFPRRDSGFPRRDGGFPRRDSGFPIRDAGIRDGGFVPDTGVRDGGTCTDADCAGLNTACIVGRCGPTGMCVPVPRPNGTTCNDLDRCTTSDSCFRGVCRGGPPLTCPPSPTVCLESFCDSSTGCLIRPAPVGTMCDDGLVCTSGDACAGGICMGTPNTTPADMCPGLPVTETVGIQTLNGNTVCGTNAGNGTCGSAGAKDDIYALTLTDPRRIRAETVTPAGVPFDTVLHVRNTCSVGMSELICDANSGAGNLSRFDRPFAPGSYFFFVDGQTSSADGDYSFELEIDPQNTCANPTVIPVPSLGNTVRFNGSTNGATNNFAAACAFNQGSPDHVYQLTVTTMTRLRFETESVPMQYDTALALHAGPCTEGNPTTIACDDDAGQGTLSKIEVQLNPGTYFLAVDGFSSGSQGVYRLAVTNVPLLSAVTFPDVGDARLTQVGTTFSQDGDFVEGIRSIAQTSVTAMEIDLQVTNNLTCDSHFTLVIVNGVNVGNLFINPGQTRVMQNFTFPPQLGPPYSLRLETQRDVMPGCGSIDYPNGVSTVLLGN